MTIPAFRRKILQWYQKNKRDLPWRKTRDPYKILVSEIMLQQTQVSRVLPKYKEFLQAFPTVESLARASDGKLLTVWSGLGYWRRAKFLKAAAKLITRDFGGKFPEDTEILQKLPGIGPYTAGAIACFAFDSTEPFIDTNIRRVYLHFFFPDKQNISDARILPIARQAVWKTDPRAWHSALFDYGATVLKNEKINQRSKHYAKQSQFKGSFRLFRATAIRRLLAEPGQQLPTVALLDFLEEQLRAAERDLSAQEILDALLKDKLIRQQGKVYRI